jgi:hypothetical protein
MRSHLRESYQKNDDVDISVLIAQDTDIVNLAWRPMLRIQRAARIFLPWELLHGVHTRFVLMSCSI